MSLFDTDQNLYDDREAVTADYVPEELAGRDAERAALREALGFDDDGSEPTDAVVAGPSGTGKTTLVRTVLDAVATGPAGAATTAPDATAYVDCTDDDTPYRVAIRVANRIGNAGLNTTGHARADVDAALADALDDSRSPVVVLDGLQVLAGTDLLGEFLDGRFAAATLVGVVDGETDSLPGRDRSAVQSIECPAYSAAELREILRARAERAFTDDALSEEVVPLCAAYATEGDGGATEAIALLRTAGDVAARELDSRVVGHHVEQARTQRERDRLRDRLDGVDDHGRLVLAAVTAAGLDGDTPVRSRTVYDRYRSLADADARDPLSARRVRTRLATLVEADLLTASDHNEGRGGGVYRRYDLPVDPDVLAAILSDAMDSPAVQRAVGTR
ncbi:MAG: Cdc6/Cdc18 family protein [Haloarculaceae archaeon]